MTVRAVAGYLRWWWSTRNCIHPDGMLERVHGDLRLSFGWRCRPCGRYLK